MTIKPWWVVCGAHDCGSPLSLSNQDCPFHSPKPKPLNHIGTWTTQSLMLGFLHMLMYNLPLSPELRVAVVLHETGSSGGSPFSRAYGSCVFSKTSMISYALSIVFVRVFRSWFLYISSYSICRWEATIALVDTSRAHTPKNEVFCSQYLMLPTESTCSN